MSETDLRTECLVTCTSRKGLLKRSLGQQPVECWAQKALGACSSEFEKRHSSPTVGSHSETQAGGATPTPCSQPAFQGISICDKSRISEVVWSQDIPSPRPPPPAPPPPRNNAD